MQVPFPGFTIDPAERAALELGDEVVALRLVAVPPAAFDALRAGEHADLPGAEPARGLEQPQRPCAGRADLARVPFARLDAPPGVLGPMVGLGGEAVHRLRPEPLPQALDQARPVLLVGSG